MIQGLDDPAEGQGSVVEAVSMKVALHLFIIYFVTRKKEKEKGTRYLYTVRQLAALYCPACGCIVCMLQRFVAPLYCNRSKSFQRLTLNTKEEGMDERGRCYIIFQFLSISNAFATFAACSAGIVHDQAVLPVLYRQALPPALVSPAFGLKSAALFLKKKQGREQKKKVNSCSLPVFGPIERVPSTAYTHCDSPHSDTNSAKSILLVKADWVYIMQLFKNCVAPC